MRMTTTDIFRIADLMTELENYSELSIRLDVLEDDNETVMYTIVKLAGMGEKAMLVR